MKNMEKKKVIRMYVDAKKCKTYIYCFGKEIPIIVRTYNDRQRTVFHLIIRMLRIPENPTNITTTFH